MARLRASTTEQSSKLYRDISPTRLLATSLKQDTSLPDLFKQKGGLQSLRPTYLTQLDSPEQDGAKTPRLLARLEMLLEEKLALVQKVGASSKGFAATQMQTDAYRQVWPNPVPPKHSLTLRNPLRCALLSLSPLHPEPKPLLPQVFDAFLHSFTTYRSILMRIKNEYDAALDDALASVYDNVHMRAELAAAEEMMVSAPPVLIPLSLFALPPTPPCLTLLFYAGHLHFGRQGKGSG